MLHNALITLQLKYVVSIKKIVDRLTNNSISNPNWSRGSPCISNILLKCTVQHHFTDSAVSILPQNIINIKFLRHTSSTRFLSLPLILFFPLSLLV